MSSPSTESDAELSASRDDKNDEDPTVLYHEEYKPWFLPLLILAPYVFPFFSKYHVTITEDELSFGYSFAMTTKLIKNRHESIQEVTPLFDQKWLGWGIHYRPDPKHGFFGRWEREYICNNGGAVKLILVDDGGGDDDDDEGKEEGNATTNTTTTFYFSTNDPQKVCDILNKRT